MADLKVIRFEPKGPKGKGLERWEDFPQSELAAGRPVQRGHNYFTDASGALTAGVWECTPMTTKLAPYSVNEFMHVLEGSVAIVDAEGREETIRAGEAFAIPKGLPCSWKQTENIRKFYVIFDDPSGAKPDPSSLKVQRFEPHSPGGKLAPVGNLDPKLFEGGLPIQRIHNYLTEPTGQMIAGVWDTTPTVRKMMRFPRNELMCLLEGEVTLVMEDGRKETYKAGDAFFVPQGLVFEWRNDVYVRKYYCIYEPKAAAAAERPAAE